MLSQRIIKSGFYLLKMHLPDGWHFYNQIDNKIVDATKSLAAAASSHFEQKIASITQAQSDCSPEQFFALRSAVVRKLLFF
jgi:hypothetical protein